jgi:hypothetical protein
VRATELLAQNSFAIATPRDGRDTRAAVFEGSLDRFVDEVGEPTSRGRADLSQVDHQRS